MTHDITSLFVLDYERTQTIFDSCHYLSKEISFRIDFMNFLIKISCN